MRPLTFEANSRTGADSERACLSGCAVFITFDLGSGNIRDLNKVKGL